MTSRPAPELPGLVQPEVIGVGGFGTVYSYLEPEFGRRVAVKVLHERLATEPVRRAFARECQAMGALSGHPHIVTVHRGGTTDAGVPYIVMDHLSAGSLADRTRRDGPLPWAEVIEIGITVAGALETAHRGGIMHLDLKPANIMISRFGEHKLGDFGIARMPGVAETTADGRVRASPAYAAPERLLEGAATPSVDVYGLGATMYALLTGRPAFGGEPGESLLATVARIVREPLPDLRERGIPDAAARAVEHLMAKGYADRPPTAAAAALELQGVQQATGRPATRAVIEGEAAQHGNTYTVPAHPLSPTPTYAPVPVATWPADPRSGPTLVGFQPPPAYAPPPPPPGQQPPARNRRMLIIGVIVAAVIAGVVAGAVALALTRRTGPPTGTPVTTSPVASPTTTAPVPTSAAPAGSVTLGPGVTHPDATAAAAVLDRYYSGINDKSYQDAFALFSPDSSVAKGGFEAWQKAQSTSTISQPVVTGVQDGAGGNLLVDVTFTSNQSAELGPDGQTCTNWELTYELSAPDWKILKAKTTAPPQAC